MGLDTRRRRCRHRLVHWSKREHHLPLVGWGTGFVSIAGSSGRTIEDSVNDATARGIFVVAAAGNDGGENDDGDVHHQEANVESFALEE